LFARYPTPADFAAAPLEELEEAVRPTGFYRNKARNIQATSQMLVASSAARYPRPWTSCSDYLVWRAKPPT